MPPNPFSRDCPTRQILDRIGDQWTVLIILVLSGGPLRFTEIGTRVEGISQKMLTQTLRSLVRDGMLRRTAYAVIPPRVDYELTELGRDLAEPMGVLDKWARTHMEQILRARDEFDRQSVSAPADISRR